MKGTGFLLIFLHLETLLKTIEKKMVERAKRLKTLLVDFATIPYIFADRVITVSKWL
jgi:hypothetical protein